MKVVLTGSVDCEIAARIVEEARKRGQKVSTVLNAILSEWLQSEDGAKPTGRVVTVTRRDQKEEGD